MPTCVSKWQQPAAKRGLGTGTMLPERVSLRSAPHLTSGCAYEAQSSPIKNMTGGCCQKEQVSVCN